MLIRRMTIEDIPSVVEIEKQCFSLPWSKKSFLDSISRDDTIFLVCEEGIVEFHKLDEKSEVVEIRESVVTGYVGMYLSFDEANITNVAVSPIFRGKGYGEQLVTEVKIAAKTAGAEYIFLEVRASNEPAISLYKKLGFEELGTRKKFYEHPVEDAIIMKVGI